MSKTKKPTKKRPFWSPRYILIGFIIALLIWGLVHLQWPYQELPTWTDF